MVDSQGRPCSGVPENLVEDAEVRAEGVEAAMSQQREDRVGQKVQQHQGDHDPAFEEREAIAAPGSSRSRQSLYNARA